MQNKRPSMIDPTALSKKHALLLQRFLDDAINTVPLKTVWYPNTIYHAISPYGDKPIEFQLTHQLVHRFRINPLTGEKEARYSVLANNDNLLDSGSFGKVYEVLGTLKTDIDKQLVFDCHKSRIMKVINYNNEKQEKQCRTEASICVDTPHLNAKWATTTAKQVFILMKRFPGLPLDKFLIEHQHDLTMFDRITLALQLLIALNDQVHRYNKVHRDIKPSNVLVSLECNQFNIIDFGFTSYINGHDEEDVCGTPGFVAPELLKNKKNQPSIATDIYAMGVVLALIFGATWGKDEFKDKIQLSTLFQGMHAVSDAVKQQIIDIVTAMVHPSSMHRIALEKAISAFIEIVTVHYHESFCKEYNLEALRAIHKNGYKLHEVLSDNSIREFKSICYTIRQYISALDNSIHAINIFHYGHRIAHLRRHKTIADLNHYITQSLSQFETFSKLLPRLIALCKGLLCSLDYPASGEKDAENTHGNLNKLIYQLELVQYKLHKRQIDFDKTIDLLNILSRQWPGFEASFQQSLYEVNKIRTNYAYVDKRLAQLKKLYSDDKCIKAILVNQITEYMIERQKMFAQGLSVPGLAVYTIPADRLQTINEILDIVVDADQPEMICEHISAVIKSMRTGWLFASTLETKLKEFQAVSHNRRNAL